MTHLDTIAADPGIGSASSRPLRGPAAVTAFTAIELHHKRPRTRDAVFTSIVVVAGVTALALVVLAAGVVLAR